MRFIRTIVMFVLPGLFAGGAGAVDAPRASVPAYVGQGMTLHVSVRTADQITAFYTGRGFPAAMIREFDAVCFVTVGMRHMRKEVLWLEPARWRFVDVAGKALHRLDRDRWNRRWEEIQAPPAARATFGWTQLPESRDLQPGEPVAGNVTIERPSGAFALELLFPTGADRSGAEVTVRVAGLTCDPRPDPASGGQP